MSINSKKYEKRVNYIYPYVYSSKCQVRLQAHLIGGAKMVGEKMVKVRSAPMKIGGKEYQTKIGLVETEKLVPDLEQPRRFELEEELKAKGLDCAKAKAPEGIMFATRMKQLEKSIIENKGISLPLVVEKVGKTYTIIDGDRRLGAVKSILNNKKLLEENPGLENALSKLPCLIIEGPLEKDEKLRILAHMHIHLAPWRPVAKGKVIKDLTDTIKAEEKVALIMGITKYALEKQLKIEELAKKFAFKGPSAISYARELASLRKDLLNDEIIGSTVERVRKGIIKSPLEIRKIRKILKDPELRQEYVKSDKSVDMLEVALKTKEFEKSLTQPTMEFKEILRRLIVSIKNVKFEALAACKGNGETKSMIEEAISTLSLFKSYIE
jgi:ParB-like chromosome segregation protein Spo0J